MSSSSEDRIEPGWEIDSMVADIERKAALITTLQSELQAVCAERDELKAQRFTVLKAQRDELKAERDELKAELDELDDLEEELQLDHELNQAACDEFLRRVQGLRVVDRALV